ncbi:penicillin acylase family protein [Streptomyces sp. NA02536]|uniref:penicillin acylase family protein n=1 Tax=Streptomyces sp. NA02536 TaxID=2742133 RepID=UPI0020CB2C24|nr:penicillin acylase family protein [Streptomyces sp. NA02536]
MVGEIFRDPWGIPHLRADDANGLAHVQGRVTALDRAWQLEVERHRAQGTSASFLGPEALPWDRFVRRARLSDTARRCWDELERTDPGTAEWVRAYVTGVNEGLRSADAPEFTRTGLVPGRWEPWTPLAVWLSTHILFAGFPAKLWREHITSRLGADAVGLFAADGPGTAGSNGWLVAGDRTVTGHAVIAGDPHRFIEDPGVYQQIRLSCPEFDVVGLAVPGVPGIAHFGHTGSVAWAITNAMADYQDLYRERLRRTGAGVEALGPDGTWRRAARHTETVEVAGEEPVEVEVVETDRGPVVIGGPEGLDDGVPEPGEPPPAVALRYPPRVTGDLGFGALLPLLRARRVADVDRAVDRWAEPVNVIMAADTEGGTLHRVAGRVPVRSAANGTRLVPAWEPGYEWRGWHEPPRADLTDGVAVMANQRGPASPLGVEFAPPHRADRITELLSRRHRWSAADMPAIHMDTHLASATPLLTHLTTLGVPGSAAPTAVPDATRPADPAAAVGGAGPSAPPVPEGSPLAGPTADPDVPAPNGPGAARDAAAEPAAAVGGAGSSHPAGGSGVVPEGSPLAGSRAESGAPASNGPGAARDSVAEPAAAVGGAGSSDPAGGSGVVPEGSPLAGSTADPDVPAPNGPGATRDAAAELAAAVGGQPADCSGVVPEGSPSAGSTAGADGPVPGGPALSEPAAALRERLAGWDRRMDAGSADAALFAAVRGAVVRRLAAHPAFAGAAVPPPYPEIFRPWLALVPRVGHALEHLLSAEELFGIDRREVVREALEEVAARPPAGTWGDTHRLAPWRALPPTTPYDEPGLSGDHDCVLCTSPVPGLTDLAARGPAARYVWDLARREDSRWVVPLGASGVPGSPHHRDQQPLWLAGDLVPVVTDWAQLTKETDV